MIVALQAAAQPISRGSPMGSPHRLCGWIQSVPRAATKQLSAVGCGSTSSPLPRNCVPGANWLPFVTSPRRSVGSKTLLPGSRHTLKPWRRSIPQQVQIIEGRYQKKPRRCRSCGVRWTDYVASHSYGPVHETRLVYRGRFPTASHIQRVETTHAEILRDLREPYPCLFAPRGSVEGRAEDPTPRQVEPQRAKR